MEQIQPSISKNTKLFLLFWTYLMITAGCLLVAVAMELLLSPNGLIDGGVTGISIMTEKLWGIPLNLAMFTINLPILLFTGKALGRKFFVRSLFANILTLIFLQFLHDVEPLTFSELLTTVYAAILLGLGVGIVIRYGGAIDGTEMLAVWLHKRKGMSVSNFLLGVNVFIIFLSIFVFSLESAMFSFIIFYLVSEIIDRVEHGLVQKRTLFIISNHADEIGKVLMEHMHLTVTYLQAQGGYSKKKSKVIYCIVNPLVYSEVKDKVMEMDSNAIIDTFSSTETQGLSNLSPYAQVLKQKEKLTNR